MIDLIYGVTIILLGIGVVTLGWGLRNVALYTIRLSHRVEWLEERQPKIEGGRVEWPSATGTNTPAPIEFSRIHPYGVDSA